MFRFEVQTDVSTCTHIYERVIATLAIKLIETLAQRRLALNASVSGNSRRHTGNGSRGPNVDFTWLYYNLNQRYRLDDVYRQN